MAETIIEALVRDHNAVMRDVAAVRSNPRLAARLYPGIADAIRRHSAAEEATFYQALRRISGLDARTVSSLEAGHKQIATILAALDRTPYGTPLFAAGFLQMSQLLAAHVNYEEDVVFPRASRELPITRQYALARRYKQRMGATRAKNVSMVNPREANCACKNPCACASCSTKTNPKIRRRPRWYHHFAGMGAPLLDMLTVKIPQVNATPGLKKDVLMWPSPYTAPIHRHGSYSTTIAGRGPTYG
jgi:hemerythrin-like domain-containing protein